MSKRPRLAKTKAIVNLYCTTLQEARDIIEDEENEAKIVILPPESGDQAVESDEEDVDNEIPTKNSLQR